MGEGPWQPNTHASPPYTRRLHGGGQGGPIEQHARAHRPRLTRDGTHERPLRPGFKESPGAALAASWLARRRDAEAPVTFAWRSSLLLVWDHAGNPSGIFLLTAL